MATKSYNYDPANIAVPGRDKMRFELGDTMVEGKENTTALTDEEINGAIALHPKSWKRAKLACLESIYRRFAYEVDTRTGPLTLSLHERAELWRKDYEDLKAELENTSVPKFGGDGKKSRPYFHKDMQKNERTFRG